MVDFVMLIGIPGSGKSTWARQYVNAMKQKYPWRDFVIMSSDEIRKELWGTDTDQRDPASVFRLLNDRTFHALASHKSVVYDATNCTKRDRKSILELLPETDGTDDYIEKIAVVFLPDVEKCNKQDKMRDRQVGPDVIGRYAKKFAMPTKDEGFDAIYIVKDGYGTEQIV